MDSSSDGSFAWTDASNDSTDSETMAKTNHTLNQSGEESESGKSYKKKLQKRLFSSGGDDEANSAPSQNQQPRKRKLSQHQVDVDNSQNSKKRQVKTEPESDADVSKKRKKKLLDSANDLYDERFLDSKVKSEQDFVVPSPVKMKKNKKKSVPSANDTSTSNGDIEVPEIQISDSKGASNSEITCEDISTPGSSHTEEDNTKKHTTKAKKNKKKSSGSEVGDTQNGAEEDSVRADETPVSEQHISMSLEELSVGPAGTYNHVNHNGISTNRKSKNSPKTILETDDAQNRTSVQINSESLFTKRKSRMSERIQFEEEDDSDVEMKNKSIEVAIKSTDNKKLTKFLESSASLRPFRTKLPGSLVLTEEDDVWLIRCPKDVNLGSFQDKKWTLDSRCKIKLDGQTYEGDIGDTNSNITVLSSENNSAVLKNVTIKGCIRLRRRLPKAHIQEDNVMVNNQINFIPLPDTKCRHPLFGLHYKKSMKIPSSIAERLHAIRAAPPTAQNRKKKRDRDKSAPQLKSCAAFKMEHSDGGAGALEELTQSMNTSKKKKKKKRKHSEEADDEHCDAPRSKRTKRNIESAELWESEKAIEENLFNF